MPAGGGGGGGRIALQAGINVFLGQTTAFGAGGFSNGGAGTICTTPDGKTGQVLVDNAGPAGLTTYLQSQAMFDLTAQGGAILLMPGSLTIGNLMLHSNAWVSVTNLASAQLTANGNVTIDFGAGIIADSLGYSANQGKGPGRGYSYFTGGGGAYGGNGGNASGLTAFGGISYGSFSAPTDQGSGGAAISNLGPGSAGGGAIHLIVNGTLIVNGRISADGGAGLTDGSGGGSGGSVWLNAGTLAGGGVISANGGTGNGLGVYAGGGGAGGRIAIQSGGNLFFGAISARGGAGYARGGAGTIYDLGRSQSLGQLLVDNGGTMGTNTAATPLTIQGLDVTIQGGAIASVQSQASVGNLLVASNGWLVLTNQFSQTLNASGNVTVQSGGAIIADGAGSPPGSGPGAGKYVALTGGEYTGGGGGYGGFGGNGAGPTSSSSPTGGMTYGSLTSPINPGSGGGGPYSYNSLGGAGGGALHLTVTGTLDVDGLLTANGSNGASPGGGGGSGGSLWLTVGTLSGAGTISANGGNGNGVGGGGGGGRISIQYNANAFSGALAAQGGNGTNRGGAGTIFTKANSQANGHLVIDNGGIPGATTTWSAGGTLDLTITGGATVTLPSQQLIGNLLIGPGSVLLGSEQTLTITGNATVQAGGSIVADSGGYGPGQGPGAGRYIGGGGGHGGYGANGTSTYSTGGGATYGSLTAPSELGSGGGGGNPVLAPVQGGAGGGIVHLYVTGTLTVAGRISANGGSSAIVGAGGGSGGSILLSVGTLTGSGQISANGGNGSALSGGGGGGRVAILCSVNAFGGTVSAYGGGGYAWGGAGTVYVRATPDGSLPSTQVIVDNGGQSGTNTTWLPDGTFDLIIRGAGIAVPPGGQVLNSLQIASNSWMSLNSQPVTIIASATVQAGGGIVADGTGYASGQGPGGGRFVNVPAYGYLGGGGGYGGYGASGAFSTQSTGGLSYGSFLQPNDSGSGGGGYPVNNAVNNGGAGGGLVRLSIQGALNLNGRLSANGAPGVIPGAGGGSGGGISLTVGTLSGSGLISANGGDGNGLGGGGGGGRIAIQYAANTFSGPITAFGGGGGSSWGGAGTIYVKRNNPLPGPQQPGMGQMLVDNGGRYGTNTLISSQQAPFDLTVRNGAALYVTTSSLLLSNLDVGPGGLLSFSAAPTNFTLITLKDALIEAGGELIVNGKGYTGMTGPGSGSTSNAIGSGGGYGGKGGASSLQPGGPAYGSALQPTDRGSSGGFGYGTWTGGSEGGGALRLSVGRVLTVNGSLSANGNPGLQDDAGGGSGGSLWISAAAFAGTGAVSADGGASELSRGGGGGGGRIAIYSPANVFGGSVSAAGNSGFSRGADGTVYYSSTLPMLQVVSQSPASIVTYAVSSVDVTFNAPVNLYSVSGSDAAVTIPVGALPGGNVTLSATGPTSVRVTFPPQTAEGAYSFSCGSQLQDLYGQPLAQVYTGSFAIAWPVIQGLVTDSQNHPVPGVLLQPDGGLTPTYTDNSGSYSLKVVPSGSVTVVPSMTNLVFVPRAQSYAGVAAPLDLQNYLAVNSIVPTPSVQYQAEGMLMTWQGVPGVTYQPLCSTNLVDWVPYGDPVVGTNGPSQVTLSYDASPQMFFRLGASN